MKYQLLTSVLIASIASRPIKSVHKDLSEVSNSSNFEENFDNFGLDGEDYSDGLDAVSQPWQDEYFDEQQALNLDDNFGVPVEDNSADITESSQLDQEYSLDEEILNPGDQFDSFGEPIDDGYSEFGVSQLSQEDSLDSKELNPEDDLDSFEDSIEDQSYNFSSASQATEEDGLDYGDIDSYTISQNSDNFGSNTDDILSNPDKFDDLMEYGNLDTDMLNQMAEINDAIELEAMNNKQSQLDQEQDLDNEDSNSSTNSQNSNNLGSNTDDILSNPDNFDDLMEYGNLDTDTLNHMAEINDAIELEAMNNKQSQLDQEQKSDEQNNINHEDSMNADAATSEESISDLEESKPANQAKEPKLNTDTQSSEANKETQLTNTTGKPADTKLVTENNSTEAKKEDTSPSAENKPVDQNPATDAKPDKEEVMDPLKAKAKEWWETGANFFQSFWK